MPLSSQYGTILNATRAVVQGLNLLVPASVIRRKVPYRGEEDALPLIVISPEGETIGDEDSENGVSLSYGVRVSLIAEGDFLLEGDGLDLLLSFRQQIRTALHKPTLNGASGVYDCTIDLDPPFPLPAVKGNYDTSSVVFHFLNHEARSA
jgi:hypothetical protein